MLCEIRSKSISQLQEQHKLQECKPAPTEYLARALQASSTTDSFQFLSTSSILKFFPLLQASDIFPNGRQVSQQDNQIEAFIPYTWLTAIQNTQGCANIVGQKKNFQKHHVRNIVKGILNQNTFHCQVKLLLLQGRSES